MNVTFLIGNGFDLGIGLKTAYSDFYDVYCKPNDDDSIAVKKFKSELQGNYKNWSDFETAFGEYAGRVDTAAEYLSVFEDFVIKFSDYLKQEEKHFDSLKSSLIIQKMKEALISYYDIRPADRGAITHRINGVKVFFRFISFNYTKCLNDCLALLKQQSNYDADIKGYIREIVHVHGFTERNMIMGVNDAGQIKNQAFSEDEDVREEIIKPLQNQSIRMNFDNNAVRLIGESDIICIYGMSIGATDRKWWKLVMDWLQESSSNHLIVLQHSADMHFTFHWNRLVKEIRTKLFLYGDVPEGKRKILENRIHIDVNHDIFAMNLRNQTPQPVQNGVFDTNKILSSSIDKEPNNLANSI